MKKNSHLVIGTLAIGTLALSGCGDTAEAGAAEEDFPTAAVEMVIPYPPGGGSDVLFRLMAEYAEEHLGQPIVPVNVEGASATVGSRQVKDSEADGYTILGTHQVTAAAFHTDIVDYGFEAFDPIALGTSTPHLPSVSTEFAEENDIEDLEGFLDYVEANPGEVTWAFTTGSEDHYTIAAILDAAGIDPTSLNYVNYNGTGPQYAALISGEVDGMTGDYASGEGYIEDGSMMPLGVVNEERDPQLPDLPTVAEQGIDFSLTVDRGFLAPEGTPAEHIDVLEAAFEAAFEDEEFQERVEELGSYPNFMNSEDYQSRIDELDSSMEQLAEQMKAF